MSGAAVIFVRHPEVAGNRIDADVIRRIEVAQAAAETADRLKEIAVAVEFFDAAVEAIGDEVIAIAVGMNIPGFWNWPLPVPAEPNLNRNLPVASNTSTRLLSWSAT